MKQGGRIRLNLALTPAVKERLADLQGRIEADTMTEVIRRALAVYERILELDEEGFALEITDRDGKVIDRLRVWPS